MIEYLERLDRALFLFLNQLHSPFFDQLMWHFSGKYEWIPLYLILLYIIYRSFGRQIWKILIGTIVVITLADQLSVHLFKEVFERYRPCHNQEIANMVHLVNEKCGGKYGFISSHATNTFALATFIGNIISLKRSNLFLYGLIIWAGLVSYSRIYLGVHYPSDVLGGAIFGFFIGAVIYKLTAKIINQHQT